MMCPNKYNEHIFHFIESPSTDRKPKKMIDGIRLQNEYKPYHSSFSSNRKGFTWKWDCVANKWMSNWTEFKWSKEQAAQLTPNWIFSWLMNEQNLTRTCDFNFLTFKMAAFYPFQWMRNNFGWAKPFQFIVCRCRQTCLRDFQTIMLVIATLSNKNTTNENSTFQFEKRTSIWNVIPLFWKPSIGLDKVFCLVMELCYRWHIYSFECRNSIASFTKSVFNLRGREKREREWALNTNHS